MFIVSHFVIDRLNVAVQAGGGYLGSTPSVHGGGSLAGKD
jgi:hypothetical protein